LEPVKRELHALALGGSVPTPPEGITGEVLVVDSFQALEASADKARGRIVLFDVPFTNYGDTVVFRADGPVAAAKQGAIAMLLRSVTPSSLNTPHTGGTWYEPDVPSIPAAALTVEDAAFLHRLSDRGSAPIVQMHLGTTTGLTAMSANVVGDVVGREKPEEIVLLACHLDSWDVGQGAQDDGAGCVIAMEAAALIARLPVQPRRTVRVVLYTGEEYGISGGKAYAAAHATEVANHVAAIEADTGAGEPLGFRLDVRAGSAGKDAPESMRATTVALGRLAHLPPLLEPLSATSLSAEWSGADISPLVEQGVPGLGLDQDMTGYWPIHHTEADTVDKVDPQALRRNVAAMAIAAYTLAEMPETLRAEEVAE
jgi:carboxypeptidase Q